MDGLAAIRPGVTSGPPGGYRTIELPGGLDPERIAPLRAAVAGLVEI